METTRYQTVSDALPSSSLGKNILVPLGATLLALVVIFVTSAYWRQHHEYGRALEAAGRDFQRSYRRAIEADTAMMRIALELLTRDESLRRAFLSGDRDELLKLVQPVYEKLQADGRVTHLYFIGLDRRVVLRAHQPERFGDVIDRFTLLAAESTGKSSQGVELGPLGTFTQRVVAPWSDRGEPLGYLELGAKVSRVLAGIGQQLSLDAFVLVDKSFLDRANWELGNGALDRQEDWETFTRYALADGTLDETARNFVAEHFGNEEYIEDIHDGDIETFDGRYVQFKFTPLLDVVRRQVGYMVIMHDITAVREGMQRTVLTTAGVCVLLAGMLFLLVYRLVTGVERRLYTSERDRDILRDLSRRDSLTELLNQREFYQLLGRQLERARNSGASLSVLMLDVDHFKPINDRYGHRTGDRVLRAIADLLRQNVRPLDALARYGGEEFAIILPDMSSADAAEFAERIRRTVVATTIRTDAYDINVTVSIGAAAFPVHGASSAELVGAADDALYAAKHAGRNRVCIANGVPKDGPAEAVPIAANK
jgi:diguanylate cyclase (GGDEF)-like protein